MNKYELGDFVFLIDRNKIHKEYVTEIVIKKSSTKTSITYSLSSGKVGMWEKDLFKTREELIASL